MKRSIVIIACVIAAVVIIPLVAQTSRSGNAEKACSMGQGQGCKAQCEAGKNCETCPKKASGECEGCEKQCEAGKKCEDCPKKESGECQGCEKQCKEGEGCGEWPKAQDATPETTQGCGMGGGCGMGAGMTRGCGMGQGAEI
jgi:hypothetical protein